MYVHGVGGGGVGYGGVGGVGVGLENYNTLSEFCRKSYIGHTNPSG